jgi:hypothetical protein
MMNSRGMGCIRKKRRDNTDFLEGGKRHARRDNTDFTEYAEGGQIGLYDRIHAKRKRIAAGSGETMRKPGSPGAPTAKAFKRSALTAK